MDSGLDAVASPLNDGGKLPSKNPGIAAGVLHLLIA
jgi:hypothetical protein